MKNTIKINGINITVEGCPVAINDIELTSEMSAQEIATSGGLIKQLVSELKPLITEAIKPAITPTTTAPNNYNSNRNYSNNYKNNKNYDNKGNYNKNDNRKDLQKVFSSIQKPECLTAKDAEWRWKPASDTDVRNRCSVCVQNDEFNVIRVHIMTNATWVHIHKYPSETKIDGCKFEQLPDFLKWSGMPEELQQYILKVVAL